MCICTKKIEKYAKKNFKTFTYMQFLSYVNKSYTFIFNLYDLLIPDTFALSILVENKQYSIKLEIEFEKNVVCSYERV